MHYPLLPFQYEPSIEDLDQYWYIDDLLDDNCRIQLLDKTFVLTYQDRGFSVRIRQMNPYGNGLPCFYKGYIHFEDDCLYHVRKAFFDEDMFLDKNIVSFPIHITCISHNLVAWGEASYDMSRPLFLESDSDVYDIRGPRQVVQEALTIVSQLSIVEENLSF